MLPISKNNVRGIFICCILALILTVMVTSLRYCVYIQRSQPENTIPIHNEDIVEQEIMLNHSHDVIIDILKHSPQNSNAELLITVEQDSIKKSYVKTANDFFPTWDFLHIDVSSFNKGTAKIILQGNNCNNEEYFDVLLTGGETWRKLPFAKVNGVEASGQHLNLRYDYFSIKQFAIIYIFTLFMVSLLFCIYQKYKKILSENKIIAFGCLSILIFIFLNKTFTRQISGWASTLWMFSYRYGFISRGFAGTVLQVIKKCLTGNTFISSFFFRGFSIVLAGLLASTVFSYMNGMIKEAKFKNPDLYPAIEILSLLYICNPMFIRDYFGVLLGRNDVLLLILFIACCYCITKERFLWAVPVFSVSAILTHQMFCFSMLPMLLAIMLYYSFTEKKKMMTLSFCATLILSGIAAVYVQFFGDANGLQAQNVIADMQSRTDMKILELAVESELFMSGKYFYDRYMGEYFSFNIIYRCIFALFCILPYLYLWSRIWKNSIKQTSSKLQKLLICFIALSPLCLFVILFTPAIDWDRWFIEWMCAMSFSIFVFVRKDHSIVINSVQSAIGTSESERQKWYLVCIIWMMLGSIIAVWGEFENGINLEQHIISMLRR